ncbi:MAG TPA: hypothetical protein DEB06_01250 [Phycisphaerales bacterium]|nr:hypothetical protein [Phycisphaerales bacterium]
MAERRLTAFTLFAAALTFAPIAGCYGPGGSFYSDDRYTYVSKEWQPWTVSLVDTRTGETLWTVDVPVGQQLVVSFREGTGPNRNKPDLMSWDLMEAEKYTGALRNIVPVPPSHARRLEPTLRPVPEAPAQQGVKG